MMALGWTREELEVLVRGLEKNYCTRSIMYGRRVGRSRGAEKVAGWLVGAVVGGCMLASQA